MPVHDYNFLSSEPNRRQLQRSITTIITAIVRWRNAPQGLAVNGRETVPVTAGAMGGVYVVINNGEAVLYKWVVYCIKGNWK